MTGAGARAVITATEPGILIASPGRMGKAVRLACAAILWLAFTGTGCMGATDDADLQPGDEFEDTFVAAPDAVDAAELAGRQVIYVNFDGPTIRDCDNFCSNAPNNRSFIIGRIWGSSRVDFAPYSGARTAITEAIRRAYDRYNVRVTRSRPASGGYTMVVISPTRGDHHGVAPLDCGNANGRDIAFVYSIGSTSSATIARYAVHELGHSFGLAHVVSASDYMQWASSGHDFTRSRYDTAHPSGKCFSGDVQRSRELLRNALGLAP